MVGKVSRDHLLSASKLASFNNEYTDWCKQQLQQGALIGEYEYTPNDTKPFSTKNEVLDTCIKSAAFEVVRDPEEERALFLEMGDRQEPHILKDMAQALGLASHDPNLNEPYVHDTLLFEGSPDGMGVATQSEEETLVIEPHTQGFVKVFTPNNEPLEISGKGILEAKYKHYASPRNDCPLTLGRLQAQGLLECANYNWYAVGVQYGGQAIHVFVYPRNPLFKEWLSEIVLDFNRRLKEVDYYEPEDSNDANIIWPTAADTVLELDKKLDVYADEYLAIEKMEKNMAAAKDSILTIIKAALQDSRYGKSPKYTYDWPERTYKATDEITKIIPAKAERTIRTKTIKIKEVQTND